MTYTKIAVVTGATATGKSRLALRLAERFGGEIVSCDSMQLFCGMDIGTAKPTKEERARVKHHMVDILDIGDSFSVAEYVRAADLCIANIYAREKVPIFCGGTGLYVNALVHSTDFGEVKNLPEYREELRALAAAEGPAALHRLLAEKDPAAAEKIDPRNVKRVIRALEVFKATGTPISEWQRRSKLLPPKYDSLEIVLEYRDRALLYDRINRRVDAMMAAGLLEEADALRKKGLFETANAKQAIGYKEFLPYFDGTASLDACVEQLKTESRRYAKRQMTWFRADEQAKRIVADRKTDDEIFEEASALFEAFFRPDVLFGGAD